MVAAILGTTISPYLFFWQAAQEVEDTKTEPVREPLRRRPAQGANALARIRLDTLIGMALSNLVALAIMATSAATLHGTLGKDLDSAAQAAEALRPLAGSAAYALGEARGWPVGLSRQPKQAKAFYAAIAVATLVGAIANVLKVSPIKALISSAVLNALAAAPIMVLIMRIATQSSIMGRFTISFRSTVAGWIATGVMALASLGFILSLLW